MIKKYTYCIMLAYFPCIALAAVTPAYTISDSSNRIEISVAGGPLRGHVNNTHLVVSPYETDSVLVKHVSNSVLGRVGVGYAFKDKVLLELNLYHANQSTIKGIVWQYQLPQFNNYHFNASNKNTRLMLDVKPRLFSSNTFSPYLILGVGVSQNTISYSESVTGVGVAPNSNLSLGSRSSARFAYDLGLGVRMDVDTRVAASLEYLYTSLGSVAPSGTPSNSVALISPPKFRLSSQAILFGLSLKV